MGLLLSDTLLIDPLLDETLWSRDAVGAWAYALDATYGGDQHETADLSTCPNRTWDVRHPSSTSTPSRLV